MFDAATLKSTQTPLLNIAYHDTGPAQGAVAMLLHGWPDDAQSWAALAGTLNQAGWRTVAPYLRGFGNTRFLSNTTLRSGDLAALAQDALDLATALSIDRFAVIGHDWGARAAYIAACVAPERISHCVAMSVGWGTNDPHQTLSLKQIQNYWYHWYMALDRGAELIRADRKRFTRYIWDSWAIRRPLDEQTFERLAGSFENPDWAEVVLHSYRVRWGFAAADPAYREMAARVAADPTIDAPTLVLHGGADPCNDPSTSEGKEAFFRAGYARHVLPGVGHFPQWEAAHETARRTSGFLGIGP